MKPHLQMLCSLRRIMSKLLVKGQKEPYYDELLLGHDGCVLSRVNRTCTSVRQLILPVLLNVCPLGQLSLRNIFSLFTIYYIKQGGSCLVLQVNCSEAKNNHYYIPELTLVPIRYMQWAKKLFFSSSYHADKALSEILQKYKR